MWIDKFIFIWSAAMTAFIIYSITKGIGGWAMWVLLGLVLSNGVASTIRLATQKPKQYK